MFLTPDDHVPFFGGTYFPKQPRYGMPAFVELLERVGGFYRDERRRTCARRMRRCAACSRISSRPPRDAGTVLTREPLARLAATLSASVRPALRRLRPAPKFPHTSHASSCCSLADAPVTRLRA